MATNRKITTVDIWRSYNCTTKYSISLCDSDGGEIRCVGGDDDIEDAWEAGREEAERYGVPARLIPTESGEVTREWEPEVQS